MALALKSEYFRYGLAAMMGKVYSTHSKVNSLCYLGRTN